MIKVTKAARQASDKYIAKLNRERQLIAEMSGHVAARHIFDNMKKAVILLSTAEEHCNSKFPSKFRKKLAKRTEKLTCMMEDLADQYKL